MIPEVFVDRWRVNAPWQSLVMIEQDLILSRALVELYSQPEIAASLAFRGGTALNKIYLTTPSRFSEDIDLTQLNSEPIGNTLDVIRSKLDGWLGKPRINLTNRSAKIIYKYNSIGNIPMRLKVEINTKEHFYVEQRKFVNFVCDSDWFLGKAKVLTYTINELIATKLRALYQRNKGRDLFDLWLVLDQDMINPSKMIEIFLAYCKHDNQIISRALFEENLEKKQQDRDFLIDMEKLLPHKIEWKPVEAIFKVKQEIISLLPGDPWRGNQTASNK